MDEQRFAELEARINSLEWIIGGQQGPPFEYAPNPRCRVTDQDGKRCIRPDNHDLPHQLFQLGDGR